jgi:ABC transporter ATM
LAVLPLITANPDGLARVGSAVFQELRNAIFANVAQKAIRQVACNTFSHLLAMDLGFHLSRQTGGLSRAIDRGTKGISSMLTWIVFHIAPTLLEIGMVSGILVCQRPFGEADLGI